MQARGWIILRVLLNRFHQGPVEAMLRCLPQEDAHAILAQEIHSTDAKLALSQPQELINRVHYSWLLPAIKSLPQGLHAPILKLLPKERLGRLQKLLPETLKISPEPLSPFVQKFLAQILYHSLEPGEVLPVEYLPKTPLTDLVYWTKPRLMELMDLLGIHDLAEEMRHIIDKQRLSLLQPCLTTKKKQFLRLCLHKTEKIATSRIGLDKWDGDCRKLNQLIHQRGLLRLGKALCSQHPDLVWHIAHVLDSGRGEAILNHYSSAAIPGVTPVLVQQVINTINFLNNNKSAA